MAHTASWEELLKQMGLSTIEIACAIGWLAREDKIIISQEIGFPILKYSKKLTINNE